MAAAHRPVLRQVENERYNQEAETAQQKKDLHKASSVGWQVLTQVEKTATFVLDVHATLLFLQRRSVLQQSLQLTGVSAARSNTTASGRTAMRRSGRAGDAKVNYRSASRTSAQHAVGIEQAKACCCHVLCRAMLCYDHLQAHSRKAPL